MQPVTTGGIAGCAPVGWQAVQSVTPTYRMALVIGGAKVALLVTGCAAYDPVGHWLSVL